MAIARRVRTSIVVAALVIGAIGTDGRLGAAAAAAGPPSPPSPPTICSRPDDAAALHRSPQVAAGHRAAQDWLLNDRSQAELSAIHDVIEPYDDVLVGQSRDHGRQVVLLVVDPDADPSRIDGLRAAVDHVRRRLGVEVRSSCRSKASIDATTAALAGGVPVDDASAYAFAVEPTTGEVAVVASDAVLGGRIADRFGDAVDVTVAPSMGRDGGGRTNDSSPHFGDANINGACSTNFSYTSNVFGTRITATAGHCGPVGTDWFSGPQFVGETVFRSFPDPDVAMIYAAGQSHTNRIYTDPCCPSTRTVIGKVNPGVGASVCHGGAQSLAQCGIEVINTNAQYCDGGGCSNNLTQLFRLGDPDFALGGDSGGIIYQRSGASNALAAGLHIASAGPVFGGYTSWHHKISTVEAILQSTLLTTP